MHPARLIRNRLIGIVRRTRAQVERLRPQRESMLELATVTRRLQLVLGAMFNQPLGDGLLAQHPTANPDERSILLPSRLPERDDALERYRLLAIEQGARIARGTRTTVPTAPIERDLYMIIEGAAIDAELAERAPGLARSIGRMRKEELDRRPSRFIGKAARPIEDLLRQ